MGTLAPTEGRCQGRLSTGPNLLSFTPAGRELTRRRGIPRSAQYVSEQRLTLAESLQAPAHARAWTALQLPPLPTHIVEDALLLVSELVTNAVRHGRPDIVISLAITADRIRVEVRDGGDSLPMLPAGHPSIDRATGRGLLIVAATAHDWGVERMPGIAGKTVWAELDMTASPVS